MQDTHNGTFFLIRCIKKTCLLQRIQRVFCTFRIWFLSDFNNFVDVFWQISLVFDCFRHRYSKRFQRLSMVLFGQWVLRIDFFKWMMRFVRFRDVFKCFKFCSVFFFEKFLNFRYFKAISYQGSVAERSKALV